MFIELIDGNIDNIYNAGLTSPGRQIAEMQCIKKIEATFPPVARPLFKHGTIHIWITLFPDFQGGLKDTCSSGGKLKAIRTKSRNNAIKIVHFITGRQSHFHLFMQAFYLTTIRVPEMKMIMPVLFFSTINAKSKVLLATITNHLMNNFVLTETIKHPVNCSPVDIAGNCILDHFMA